jgi:hypothetical protein
VVTVTWDPLARPQADLAARAIRCPRPYAVEAHASYLHELAHVLFDDEELRALPRWRREATISRYVLRAWHDANLRDFDRCARHLASCLWSYIQDEQVPRVIIERHIPPALDWQRWRDA